ncbi:MAG: hypothetical protein R3F48_00660 [Candidatus Zixiibacteriota bacterium]
MNRVFVLLLVMFAAFLMLTGCDREIKGNVVDTDNTNENCFECHNGLLDQAQGEWANSIHASGNTVDYTNRGGSDCTKCHDQEGYISFLATGELPDVPFENVSAIGCFTCHDPHGNGDMSIRFVGAYTLENGDVFDHGNGNQCASCHHSRMSADDIVDNTTVNSRYGPHHGPQGDLINGSNGYEFPGEGYSFATSPHALVVDNACIGCHMGDPSTHIGYKIGGHSFNMVDEESGEDLHALCADASCHGTAADEFDFTADADYDHDGTIEGYQTEIEGMMDSLIVLLQGQGILNGTGGTVSGTYADGHLVGALYNLRYIEEDRSEGIHNFNYARTLLEASIDYVSGLPAKSGVIAGNDAALIVNH